MLKIVCYNFRFLGSMICPHKLELVLTSRSYMRVIKGVLSLTLFGKEISGAGVGLHEGLRVEDGHVEERVLIHHTRLVLLKDGALGHRVVNQTGD